MHEYINGAILEAVEKARTLKSKIPGAAGLIADFEALVGKAQDEIDQLIEGLEILLEAGDYNEPANLKEKIMAFKFLTGELSLLENVVIAAIARGHEDDAFMNQLVRSICKEINYPILKPVVSCLSQKYYHIYPRYNLLCVPLLEADFLLHIPDIYHELGHPLLALDDIRLTKFQLELGRFNKQAIQHYSASIAQVHRNLTREAFVANLQVWRDCWVEKWSTEFFCDLFGVFTLGPAYVWSNLHLCVKMSQDVYELPYFGVTSHPPDDARMQAMFLALDMIGFSRERAQIEDEWQQFIDIMGYKRPELFAYAVPDQILEIVVVHAYKATEAINCRICSQASLAGSGIIALLNGAWVTFWQNTEAFARWERLEVEQLKRRLLRA